MTGLVRLNFTFFKLKPTLLLNLLNLLNIEKIVYINKNKQIARDRSFSDSGQRLRQSIKMVSSIQPGIHFKKSKIIQLCPGFII